jgi:hypothetical protein
MRLITLLFLLPTLAFARDGILMTAKGNHFLYHVREPAEVWQHCGEGVNGCVDSVRRHPRIQELWVIDSFEPALWLCAQIEAQGQNISLAQVNGAFVAITLTRIVADMPAPVPLCGDDRFHTSAEAAGLLQNIEQWEATKSVEPVSTGKAARFYGSLVDIGLRPLAGKVIIRQGTELVRELRADSKGEFRTELLTGLYSIQAKPDNGRAEGPWMMAIGERGFVVDWVVGLE